VLKPLLTGLAVDSNVQNRVAMMSQVLMSRPNLEKVARETDLYLRAPTQEDFARLVDQLPTRITLQGGGRDNTYTLRYSDTDPAMAQRVVQTVLDAFVEDTLGVKRADTDTAQAFLQSQITEYEQRLRDAEDQLATFKKQNVGLLPGETGDYYTRLQTAQTKLEDLRAQVRLVEQRRTELSKQLEGEVPTFGLFEESAESGSPDGRLAEYQRQLDQLLLQYTDKHPKVIALKETMANIEAQAAAASDKKRAAAPLPKNPQEAMARALDINPVYQQLRVELSRSQVDLAELREQVSEYQADGQQPAQQGRHDPADRGRAQALESRLRSQSRAASAAAAAAGIGAAVRVGGGQHRERQVPHHRAGGAAADSDWTEACPVHDGRADRRARRGPRAGDRARPAEAGLPVSRDAEGGHRPAGARDDQFPGAARRAQLPAARAGFGRCCIRWAAGRLSADPSRSPSQPSG
jgi:polysaccharide chain length determinant protein (PEP-CTERM system associated)